MSGISDRLLSERLKELEQEGVIHRRVNPSRPIAVAYSLTEKGYDLQGVLEAIQQWADNWEEAPQRT